MVSIRFRRIGIELRRIREELGLTLDAAGELVDRSSSSLSKLETGQQGIRPSELKHILESYRARNVELNTWLLRLAKDGRKRGWWQKYARELPPETLDMISLEADATRIMFLELILIPGLLQTLDYARSLLREGPFANDERQIGKLVDIRMKRQEVLAKPDRPVVHSILDEAVLHRQVGGPEVTRRQLQHLLAISAEPNVGLQVMPFNSGGYRGMTGAFQVLELGTQGELQVVSVDSLTAISYREDVSDVQVYVDAFARLRGNALSERDSLALIEKLLSKP